MHVLAAARDLSWLELVAETLRAALNGLAHTAPEWLAQVAGPDWFRQYSGRAEELRFPKRVRICRYPSPSASRPRQPAAVKIPKVR